MEKKLGFARPKSVKDAVGSLGLDFDVTSTAYSPSSERMYTVFPTMVMSCTCCGPVITSPTIVCDFPLTSITKKRFVIVTYT